MFTAKRLTAINGEAYELAFDCMPTLTRSSNTKPSCLTAIARKCVCTSMETMEEAASCLFLVTASQKETLAALEFCAAVATGFASLAR